MVLPCNMATLWASNTRTVPTVHGCITTVGTITPVAAATMLKRHAQRKTIPLAFRSSNSCEALNCVTFVVSQ